jgi:beta-N-acetylhexosaminidase
MPATKVVVRRRRIALGLVAAAAAAVGVAVGAGGEDSGAPEEPGFCDELPARRLDRVAGQGVMVRMEDRATRGLRDAAEAGEIGGVVLFPTSDIAGERLTAAIRSVQAAAAAGGNPPLLVAIDQEGGPVERLPALPPQVAPYTLGQNDDRNAALLEGSATGFQLHELGVNVNLAPVLDVPTSEQQFMASRAFGTSAEQVSRLGLAFAAGLRREGVAATAKHFPGLGAALENTDFAPTTVPGSTANLRPGLEPFRAAVADGIELVMVSSAAYPGLGSPAPAVVSPNIVTGLLRERLGFEGVAISDDLLAPGISSTYSSRKAAMLASRAGVDVLLFAAGEAPGIARTLGAAARRGVLDEGSLRASCGRVVALKERLANAEPAD